MAKPDELKWDDFFKSQNQQNTLRKTRERVPSAQYHQDKPVGTPNKNAFSGPSEEELKKKKPAARINKPGEVPRRPTNIEISQAILANMPKQARQPTSAEMIKMGEEMGLVKSKEEMDALEKKWQNTFNDHFAQLDKPVENQKSEDNVGWADGKSFNDSLPEEERIARNMHIDEKE